MVLNKPAGLATAGVPRGESSLHSQVLAYLSENHTENGPSFLGCVNRLDVPVSGIVVMAKTPETAQALTEQLREHRVSKIYHALVSGCVAPATGRFKHWLVKGGIHSKVRCVPEGTPRAREAVLNYRTLQSYTHATLLEIQPHSGRKHQIRTQLSRFGHPIWGDYKYGSRITLTQGIALLSKEITFIHPNTEGQVRLTIEYPSRWPSDIDSLSTDDRTWLQRKN